METSQKKREIHSILRSQFYSEHSIKSPQYFRRIADYLVQIQRRIPAYGRILSTIDVRNLQTPDDFRRLVPTTNKSIYEENDLADLCWDGDIHKTKLAMTSSGSSGIGYSYGLFNNDKIEIDTIAHDYVLNEYFNIEKKRTYIINTLGMGTQIPTSLPLSSVGLRADMATKLIQKLSSHYDQFIIIAGVAFVKKLIEDAKASGVAWDSLDISFLIGEDWFSENFRSFIAEETGIDLSAPDEKTILSAFGICELGVGLLLESRETMRIRQIASRNRELRLSLFGEEAEKCCPLLFHFNPEQLLLEEVDGEILFTSLSDGNLIPLIRYATTDRGRVFEHSEISNILRNCGYSDLIPRWKLPFVSIMGRTGKLVDVNGIRCTPEHVKTALYEKSNVSKSISGNFYMSKGENALKVEIQMREGVPSSEEIRNQIHASISSQTEVSTDVVLYNHLDYPYGIGLQYEYKFKTV